MSDSNRIRPLKVSIAGVPIWVGIGFLALARISYPGVSDADDNSFLISWVVAALIILVHEFGAAMASIAFGLRPSIKLYWADHAIMPLYISELGRGQQVVMMLAGPIASMTIGTIAWLLGSYQGGIAGVVGWSALGTAGVWSVANLLPVLPLRGGRALSELLASDAKPSLRRAQIVSVAAACLALPLTFLLRRSYHGLWIFAAWLLLKNVLDIIRHPLAKPSSQSRGALTDALFQLNIESAPDAEQLALDVLAHKYVEPEFRALSVRLLLASHLIRGQHAEARAAADAHPNNMYPEHRLQVAPYRELAVLGSSAESELASRMAASPTTQDAEVIAVHCALMGRWDQVLDLVQSPSGSHLDPGTLNLCQARAFFAGEYLVSARVGEVWEERGSALAAVNGACAWARAGELEAGLAALERAAAAGWLNLETIDTDEDLAPLRELEGYADIRRQFRSGRREPGRPHGATIGLAGSTAAVLALVLFLPDSLLSLGREATPSQRTPVIPVASEISGLDPRSGNVRWRADAEGAYPVMRATGDRIVFSAGKRDPRRRNLIVFDLLDGEQLGTIASSSAWGIGVSGDIVALSEQVDREGRLWGYDLRTGKQRWERGVAAGSSWLVEDVVVHSGPDELGLSAIDVRTGKTLWERDDLVAVEGPGRGEPRSLLLATSEDADRLISLDPRSGEERWSTGIARSPTVLDRHVWVPETSAEATLIDIESGSRTTIAIEDASVEPLLELDEAAIVRTSGGISVIDLASGAARWNQTAQFVVSVAAVDGVVVAGWSGGLVAYDLESGARLWRLSHHALGESGNRDGLVASAKGVLKGLNPRDGHVTWSVDTKLPYVQSALFDSTLVIVRGRSG